MPSFIRAQLLADLAPALAMAKAESLSPAYEGVLLRDDTATSVNRSGHFVVATPTHGLDVTVDTPLLCSLLASTNATEVELTESGGRLVFRVSDFLGRLPVRSRELEWDLPTDEFRSVPSPLAAVRTVAGFTNGQRPALVGVQLRDGWGMSTDGYTLAAYKTKFEEELRVPVETAAMLRFFGDDAEVSISDRRIKASGAGMSYWGTVDDTPCINWLKLVPASTSEVIAQRADMITALKRSMLWNGSQVGIKAAYGNLVFHNPDESEVSVPCSGATEEVFVNPKFLASCLSLTVGPSVTLGFNGAKAPVLIEEGDLLLLAMPVVPDGRRND